MVMLEEDASREVNGLRGRGFIGWTRTRDYLNPMYASLFLFPAYRTNGRVVPIVATRKVEISKKHPSGVQILY